MAGKGTRRTRKETTGKTSAPPKVPQAHGGALNAGGTPGNKGGGRPPQAFKDFLATLRNDPDAQDALKKAALDPAMGSFGAAWKIVTEYDDAKPAKKLELTAPMSTAERQEAVKRLMQKVGQ